MTGYGSLRICFFQSAVAERIEPLRCASLVGSERVVFFRLCSVSQEIFLNMTAVKCLVSCPNTLGEFQQVSQVIDKTIDSQKDNA